ALEVVHVVLNTTDFKTEEAMDLAHPLRVTRSEIIVDRDNVNTAATRECIQIRRQGGDERFALARAHLSDFALMQNDAADQLHVEVTHAGRAYAGFANDCESFRQNLVKR